MKEDWSKEEIEATITSYFEMLKLELTGLSYNKTQFRRELKPLLNNRTEGAIEFKLCNISSALISLGYNYIVGYKPRSHYQELLREILVERLKESDQLEPLIQSYNKKEVLLERDIVAFDKMVVEPPSSNLIKEPLPVYGTVQRDYLKQEQQNRSTGLFGEELALNYEKWRLEKLGEPLLARQIEWVSKELGDGAGYDILSKNRDGTDRFIEVKSTTLGKETPIFFTKRESEFSNLNKSHFHLYRLFNLRKKPNMFLLNGALYSICSKIEPLSFRGYF